MHEHGAPGQKGYELSDLQLRMMVWTGVGFAILILIAYIVSTFFVKFVVAQPPITDYAPTPMATDPQATQFAPGVRLQVAPPDALTAVRADQHRQATTYGVVSEDPEIYRIPVSTAIDIVSERGLPVFPVTSTEPAPAVQEEQ